MNRTFLKVLVPIVLSCLPMLAGAGPGTSVTTSQVLPLDMPKVIAAYDKLMASAAGKQFKGRLLLVAHLADGNDPATISTVSLYKSAAEFETYSNLLLNDPARTELLTTIVPISKLVLTGRTSTIKSWGDVNDTDTIWNGHYYNVTDAPAMLAALDAFFSSPRGKAFPGQAHWAAITMGGVGAPTNVLSVGYASIAEMEAFADAGPNDPDFAKFMAASRAAGTHLGADLGRTLKTWGPATMKSLIRQ